MNWDLGEFGQRDPVSELPEGKLDRARALKNGLVALCEGSGKMDANV